MTIEKYITFFLQPEYAANESSLSDLAKNSSSDSFNMGTELFLLFFLSLIPEQGKL